MGPRSFDRGNARRGARNTPRPALQWGRGHSTAEMIEARGGTCEACGRLQWGRGHSTAEIVVGPDLRKPGERRFNGAAVIRPRKSADRGAVDVLNAGFNGAAVIRPRKLAGGFDAYIQDEQCFNGAAVIRPRKSPRSRRRSWPPRQLQWGRGHSTAEIERRADRDHVTERRFNGAAVIRPRKCRRARTVAQRLSSFNGAAVIRPRKCVRATRCTARCRRALQWGRGHSTAEIRWISAAVTAR